MSTIEVQTPPVTPARLAYILGDDRVLVATRNLLAAKQKRQALYKVPNGDTSSNGQPWANAAFRADDEARRALDDLKTAAERAVERLIREESK